MFLPQSLINYLERVTLILHKLFQEKGKNVSDSHSALETYIAYIWHMR